MALRSTCPDVQQLKQLALGHLSPEEITRLHEHVTDCLDCQSAIGSLPNDDPLLQAMQTQRSATMPEDDMVERLIERLRSLEPPPSSVASAGTKLADTASADTPVEPAPESCDFLAPPQRQGDLGHLGPYRVLRVLGSGGMGIVFEAEDLQLERKVALKVMKPSLAAHAESRKRFLREARTAAAIQHDHIVTIHQVGEDRSVPYLAMQLLEGESLESRLQREPRLPIAEVLRIGREIAEGLSAAHVRGLIHRDIKPANIWLENLNHRDTEAQRTPDQEGQKLASASDSPLCLGVSVVRSSARVKILDFGLARAADDPTQVTLSGIVAGTPAYMAPEQASDGPIDQRCDLFSLGCVLYRLSTGELPFKGAKPLTIFWAMAVKQPIPPRELNADVPRALSDVILRLLAKNPDERPRSAREVAQALLAIERQQAILPPPIIRSRRRRVALIAALLLAVLIGGAGFSYGPAVYRLATNQGQLVVETEDPDVKVIVKQKEQQVTIIDLKTKQEVTLKAGKYQVELMPPKLGLGVSAKELTLTRGGKQIVHVRWEPPSALQTLVGHKDIVWSAKFCLGGTHVVSAGGLREDNKRWSTGSDFQLRLWDVRTGQEVRRFGDHTQVVHCLAVSPDGKRVLSSGGRDKDQGIPDKTLRLWDLQTGQLIRRYDKHPGVVGVLTFSPDGKRFASSSFDKSLRLWDVETGQEIHCFEEGKTVFRAVEFSRDGKHVLSGSDDGRLRLWNADTGELVHSLDGAYKAWGIVNLSPDGRFALSNGLTPEGRSCAELWDLEKKAPVRQFRHESGWGRTELGTFARRQAVPLLRPGRHPAPVGHCDGEGAEPVRTRQGDRHRRVLARRPLRGLRGLGQDRADLEVAGVTT